MRTIMGIVILTVFVGGLYYLNEATRTEDGKSILHVAAELPVTVKVASAERRGIVQTVQAPGEVEAFSEVDVSAEVMGKILEMPVEEGDMVSEGQLLCRLDDAAYRAQVASAEARVARLEATITQANAELDKAERDFKRQVRLSESNATSALELEDYHTTLVRARATVEIRRQEQIEAEAMRESSLENLAKTVINAPIDGIVSQLFAKAGEVVITGTMNNPGTRIMVVSDLSKMQVRCRVDESDAPTVKNAQTARIYLQSDNQKSVPGHVLRVGTKGTRPQGRDVVTFETLVLVDALDHRVKPGMSANIEIEVNQSDEALTVPVEAVVHRKRRDLPEELVAEFDKSRKERSLGNDRHLAEYLKVVFCIDGEGKAHPRVVETGISDATSVEIVGGIAVDERVVIGPFRSLDQLKSGSTVKIDDGQNKPAGLDKPEEGPELKQAETDKSGDDGAAEASAEDKSDEDSKDTQRLAGKG